MEAERAGKRKLSENSERRVLVKHEGKSKSLECSDDDWIRGGKGKGLLESTAEKLQPDILGEIGKRLVSGLDVVRFRSVCKRWRSSLNYQIRFPLRVPSLPGASEFPMFITENSYYNAEQGWAAADQPNRMLIMMYETERGGRFESRAILPVVKDQQMLVAGTFVDPPIPNLSRLSFLSKAYNLSVLRIRLHNKKREWTLFPHSSRIAVLCSDRTNFNFNFARECDLTVAALLRGGELALVRLGHLQLNWETPFSPSRFKDIISYTGQLYMVDKLGTAFAMDYESLSITQVTESLLSSEGMDMVLVESSGHLYLLVSETQPIYFNLKLYRLRSHLHQWVQVEDLGDQVLFLDNSHRFSAPRDLFSEIGLINVDYKAVESVTYYSHILFSHPSPNHYLAVPISSRPCAPVWLPVQPPVDAADNSDELLAQLAHNAFSYCPPSLIMK